MALPNIMIVPEGHSRVRVSPRRPPLSSDQRKPSYNRLLKKNDYIIVELYYTDTTSILKTINRFGQDILFMIDEGQGIEVNEVNRIKCTIDEEQPSDPPSCPIVSYCLNEGSPCASVISGDSKGDSEEDIIIHLKDRVLKVRLDEPSIQSCTDMDDIYRVYPVSTLNELIQSPSRVNDELARLYMNIRSIEYDSILTRIENFLSHIQEVHSNLSVIRMHYEETVEDTFQDINDEILYNGSDLGRLQRMENIITRLNSAVRGLNIPSDLTGPEVYIPQMNTLISSSRVPSGQKDTLKMYLERVKQTE